MTRKFVVQSMIAADKESKEAFEHARRLMAVKENRNLTQSETLLKLAMRYIEESD